MSERFADVIPDVLEKYQLKNLPTVFRGITFRSRIEARWAVFFDALRLQADYEPEGFDLGDGVLYLPDFWIPKLNFWVEIKGADPDDVACEKAHRLSVASGKRVFVFFGGHVLPSLNGPQTHAYAFFPDGGGDAGYLWCQCPLCAKLGIEYDVRTDRLSCRECWTCYRARNGKSTPRELSDWKQSRKANGRCLDACGTCARIGTNGDRGENTDTAQLIAAFNAARAARFIR